MRIVHKWMLSCLLPVVAMSIAGLYAVATSRQELLESMKRREIEATRSIRSDIERAVRDRIRAWSAFAKTSAIQDALRKSNKNATKDSSINSPHNRTLALDLVTLSHQRSQRSPTSVVLTNRFGAVVASTRQVLEDQSREPWWSTTQQRDPFVGDLVFDSGTETRGIPLGIRISDDSGEFIGALQITLGSHEFADLLSLHRGSPQANRQLALLDSNQNVIHATSDFTENLPLPRLGPPTQSTLKSVTIEENTEESLSLFIRWPLFEDSSTRSWQLLAKSHSPDLLLPVEALKKRILVLSTLTAALSLFVGWILAMSFHRRLQQLGRATHAFAAGQFDSPIGLNGRDELTELSHRFNEMAGARARADRDLNRRHALFVLLHDIVAASNQAQRGEEAIEKATSLICEQLHWPMGNWYVFRDEDQPLLVPGRSWHIEEEHPGFLEFRQAVDATPLRIDEGLPGRALRSGKTEMCKDLSQSTDQDPVREKLGEAYPIKGAWAIPVLVRERVVGVIEVFSQRARRPDNVLRDITGHIGVQIGVAVERERTQRERESMQSELQESSRHAGMAELATGVLHNVGNVLNSVNITSTSISERLRRSRIEQLSRVIQLMHDHSEDLPQFLSEDEKGRHILPFLQQVSESLSGDREELFADLESLDRNIQHVKQIVGMQQSMSKAGGTLELVDVKDLLNDAVHIQLGASGAFEVVREFGDIPATNTDRHQVMQILLNLLSNAKHAIVDGGPEQPQVCVRTALIDGKTIEISVQDNGIGITKENLTRLFTHGFTTKSHGHGFGLHSCERAAKELDGDLSVTSPGEGLGATFTLRIPFHPAVVRA